MKNHIMPQPNPYEKLSKAKNAFKTETLRFLKVIVFLIIALIGCMVALSWFNIKRKLCRTPSKNKEKLSDCEDDDDNDYIDLFVQDD